MGQYSPDRPDVLGVEWPPLYARDVPLDAGIEYGQTFQSTGAETLATAFTYFSQSPPSGPFRFHLLVNVYPKGQELATGAVHRTLVPVNGGSLDGGGAFLQGGASLAEVLASSADAKFLGLPVSLGRTRVQFATAGLFTGKRILRLVLHHAIAADPAGENPEVGILLNLVPTVYAHKAAYGYILGDPASALVERTTDLGEFNPSATDGGYAVDTPDRKVWTVADVQSLATANLEVEFYNDISDGERDIHYAALEVVWCEENRVAVGCVRMGSTALAADNGGAAVGYHSVALRTPAGAANWAKPAGGLFVATVRLADAGGPFLSPLLTNTDLPSFQRGSVPSIPLLDSFDVFAPHEGRAIPVGVDNEPKSADAVSALPPFTFHGVDTVPSPDLHDYIAQTLAPVYLGVTASQEIQQQAIAANQPYPWVRFWARRYGTSPDMTVTCDGQIVTLSAATFDALTEIINGWRAVVLRFATAPRFSTSGAVKSVGFSSIASAANRWEILGATVYPASQGATGPSYGGITAAATHDGARDVYADLAVSVATAAPTPLDLTATPRSYPVVGFGPDCGTTASCIPTDIGYVDLAWGGVSLAGSGVTGTPVTGFGYYEVQRKDTDSLDFRTIGRVEDPASPRFPDFEARYKTVSTYQVRVVRDDGTVGDWSAPTSGTPPSPTNSAAGLLAFTSNVNPALSVAYGEAFTGGASEDFGFPEANTLQLQRLYQRDYQTAFRPTERGGTAFSRALLVGATAHPAGAVPSADSGFDRLRDLVWSPDLPYVCVLDDLGNRWFANVNVPSGSVKRSSGLYLAQAVITEVTDTPSIATTLPASSIGLPSIVESLLLGAGWQIGQRSGIYDPVSNKTFIAWWAGSTQWVASVDVTTHALEGPIAVGDFTAVGVDPADGHGTPTIVMDGLGYVHVLWLAHNTILQWAKSPAPRSLIGTWSGKPLGEVSIPPGTYPSATYSPAQGAIYLLYRSGATHNSGIYPDHNYGELAKLVDGAGAWTDVLAGPVPYVSDKFNRANSVSTLGSADVGGAWVANAGTWGINANRAYVPGASSNAIATIDSTHADVTVKATFAVIDIYTVTGIVLRFTDVNNYWQAVNYGRDLFLQKVVAGVATNLLGPFSFGLADGDTVSVQAVGSVLTVYHNDLAAGSVTDAFNKTATKHGLLSSLTAVARFDDFSVAPQVAPVIDGFNRANNAGTMGSADTGQAWVANAGTWGINGNAAYVPGGSAGAIATIDSGLRDAIVKAKFPVIDQYLISGIVVRYTDANNYWRAVNYGYDLFLQKVVGGVPVTVLGPFGFSLFFGDVVQLTAKANVLTLYHNGVVAGTVTDSFNNTATKHGLVADTTAVARFDDFSVQPSRSITGGLIDQTGYTAWSGNPLYTTDVYSPQMICDPATGKLWFTWTSSLGRYHDDMRGNVYCAYFDPVTGHAYDPAGFDLGLKVEWSDMLTAPVLARYAYRVPDEVTPGPHMVHYVEMVLDATGKPVLFWIESDLTTGNGETCHLLTSRWTGVAWTAPIAIDITYLGSYSSIAAVDDTCIVFQRWPDAAFTGIEISQYISNDNGATWQREVFVASGQLTAGRPAGYVTQIQHADRRAPAAWGTLVDYVNNQPIMLFLT